MLCALVVIKLDQIKSVSSEYEPEFVGIRKFITKVEI